MIRPTQRLLVQQRKIRTLYKVVPALALAVGLIIPGAARAFFPDQSGVACTAKQVDAAKIEFDAQFGAYNKSTSAAVVFCPIVYDPTDFQNADGFAWLNVIDQNPSSNASCTVTGVNRDASIAFSAAPETTSGASAVPQNLWFWSAVRVPGSSWALNARCSLPPVSSGKQSRVVSYAIEYQD